MYLAGGYQQNLPAILNSTIHLLANSPEEAFQFPEFCSSFVTFANLKSSRTGIL
jgi:hypothetical protein